MKKRECRKCRYHYKSTIHYCKVHERSVSIDFVTGESVDCGLVHCFLERSSGGVCGEDGILFEHRSSAVRALLYLRALIINWFRDGELL